MDKTKILVVLRAVTFSYEYAQVLYHMETWRKY